MQPYTYILNQVCGKQSNLCRDSLTNDYFFVFNAFLDQRQKYFVHFFKGKISSKLGESPNIHKPTLQIDFQLALIKSLIACKPSSHLCNGISLRINFRSRSKSVRLSSDQPIVTITLPVTNTQDTTAYLQHQAVDLERRPWPLEFPVRPEVDPPVPFHTGVIKFEQYQLFAQSHTPAANQCGTGTLNESNGNNNNSQMTNHLTRRSSAVAVTQSEMSKN